jgi:hypothetical protein
MSDPERVRTLLTAAGFGDPDLVDLHEPMFFGRDVTAAEPMVLGLLSGMLADLDDAARATAVSAARASLAAHLGPDGVTYRSAMWLVTAEPAE